MKKLAVLGILAVATHAVPAAAAAQTDAETRQHGCQREFAGAVDAYVRATDHKDLAAMERVLHPDDTIVMPDSVVYAGKTEAMTFFQEFFADPDWTQSFTPVRTAVDGCTTGFVLMDSVYAQPDGYRSHLLIGLTFTRYHGQWLVLLDQNTKVPG